MNHRAAGALLLGLLSPLAMAGQAAGPSTRASDAAAARARLEATQHEAQAENARVHQLKAKVGTLESHSDAAARALAERDRKIAELQKQLKMAGQQP